MITARVTGECINEVGESMKDFQEENEGLIGISNLVLHSWTHIIYNNPSIPLDTQLREAMICGAVYVGSNACLL